MSCRLARCLYQCGINGSGDVGYGGGGGSGGNDNGVLYVR